MSTALTIVPVQSTPEPPTLPPVSVTVPVTIPVSVPTTELLTDDPFTAPLTVPLTTSETSPVALNPQPADGAASTSATSAPDPSAGMPAEGPVDPTQRSEGTLPGPQQSTTEPPTATSVTRLARAARDAARDFAPAEGLILLSVLFLTANGVARRRDDLTHLQLDDRDAIVRFE